MVTQVSGTHLLPGSWEGRREEGGGRREEGGGRREEGGGRIDHRKSTLARGSRSMSLLMGSGTD